ncbi:hypothetical protein [Xenorhabdus bovienii]|uniref:hypothetical protein n=1 Tax=Xenorhabdus bovienii TaxID=40576 RepID=UPI0023B33435|nr:hypothetical protein [Xenorhabdus bovienii]MDE9544146.1 hypothetical protein [Xenorhabdus bovienii]
MNRAIICNNEIDTERFTNRIKIQIIISADVFILSNMTESAAEVKIINRELCDKVSDFAFRNAINYQELFQDDKYIYMSCFAYDVHAFKNEFKNEKLLEPLFKHKVGKTDHFMISFPDRKIHYTNELKGMLEFKG